MKPRTLLAISLCLGAAMLPAQETQKPAAAPTELETLISQLRGLDDKHWAERLKQLEELAKKHQVDAEGKRKQSAELLKQAAASDARAKALREEIAQLQTLRKLVVKLPNTPTKTKAAKPEEAAAKPKAAPAMPKEAAAKPKEPAKAKEPAAKPPAKAKEPAAKPKPPAKAKEPAAKPKAPAKAKEPAAKPPAKAKEAAAKPKAPAKAEAATAKPKAPAKAEEAAAIPGGRLVAWQHVEVIFEEQCAACHEPDDAKGGLDITSFDATRKGGGSGSSIVPGQPDQSRLYLMVARKERPFMPRNADPLEAEQVKTIATWIEQGASENVADAAAFLAKRAAELKAQAEASKGAEGEDEGPMPIDLPDHALELPAQASPIQALQRSPRAPLIAVAGHKQTLLVDGEFQRLGILPSEFPTVSRVAFSTDGSHLAVGAGQEGRRGRALVHDVVSGKHIATVGKLRDLPLAIAMHGDRVALGSSNKRTSVWSVRDNKEVFSGKHEDFVLGLSFSPQDDFLAAADRTGTVVVWDLRRGTAEAQLRGHEGAANGVAFHRSGKWLVSAGADGTVRSWDVLEGKERWRKSAHSGQALAVAIGPNDSIASSGSDGRVVVYDAAGKELAKSNPLGDWLYCVAFGTDNSVVFAGDWQGLVHRFSVKDRKSSPLAPFQPAQ